MAHDQHLPHKVRGLGLEKHPEELNAFYAARFAPSMLAALSGLLKPYA